MVDTSNHHKSPETRQMTKSWRLTTWLWVGPIRKLRNDSKVWKKLFQTVFLLRYHLQIKLFLNFICQCPTNTSISAQPDQTAGSRKLLRRHVTYTRPPIWIPCLAQSPNTPPHIRHSWRYVASSHELQLLTTRKRFSTWLRFGTRLRLQNESWWIISKNLQICLHSILNGFSFDVVVTRQNAR